MGLDMLAEIGNDDPGEWGCEPTAPGEQGCAPTAPGEQGCEPTAVLRPGLLHAAASAAAWRCMLCCTQHCRRRKGGSWHTHIEAGTTEKLRRHAFTPTRCRHCYPARPAGLWAVPPGAGRAHGRQVSCRHFTRLHELHLNRRACCLPVRGSRWIVCGCLHVPPHTHLGVPHPAVAGLPASTTWSSCGRCPGASRRRCGAHGAAG